MSLKHFAAKHLAQDHFEADHFVDNLAPAQVQPAITISTPIFGGPGPPPEQWVDIVDRRSKVIPFRRKREFTIPPARARITLEKREERLLMVAGEPTVVVESDPFAMVIAAGVGAFLGVLLAKKLSS